MDYIYYDHIPEDVTERDRCIQMSNCLTVGKEGELLLVTRLGKIKTIPPIAERRQIIEEYHTSLGMCSAERLYSCIREGYHWF